MSKLLQLRFGVSAVFVLMLGLVWMPSVVSAAPGDPQADSSRPTASMYTNNNKDAYSRSGACASIHRVVLGENLSWIAASYGVSVDDLATENSLDDTNLIYENQVLCIPSHGSRSSSERWADDNEYTSPNRSPGYGSQDVENGYQEYSYGQPGKSYDPNNTYGNQSNGYGEPGMRYDSGNSYGNQSNGYREPGKGYDLDSNYGNQSNGYGNQSNSDDLQPGQSRWSSE